MRFRMTASDCEVLRMVAECRIVTMPQLAALLSRNGKSLNQRISQLVGEGLLADATRGPGQRRGRPERIVSPTVGGIQVLQERGLIDAEVSAEVTLSNTIPCQAHQVLLNWVRVHLHRVSMTISQLEIKFLAHNSPSLASGFSNISVITDPTPGEVEPRRDISFKPDAALSISDTTQDKTVLFFLEVDRGTETVATPKRQPNEF